MPPKRKRSKILSSPSTTGDQNNNNSSNNNNSTANNNNLETSSPFSMCRRITLRGPSAPTTRNALIQNHNVSQICYSSTLQLVVCANTDSSVRCFDLHTYNNINASNPNRINSMMVSSILLYCLTRIVILILINWSFLRQSGLLLQMCALVCLLNYVVKIETKYFVQHWVKEKQVSNSQSLVFHLIKEQKLFRYEL